MNFNIKEVRSLRDVAFNELQEIAKKYRNNSVQYKNARRAYEIAEESVRAAEDHALQESNVK